MPASLRDGQVVFTREQYRTLLDGAEAIAIHWDLGESFQDLAQRLPRIVPFDHINLVLHSFRTVVARPMPLTTGRSIIARVGAASTFATRTGTSWSC
jgi:hypothetical protein